MGAALAWVTSTVAVATAAGYWAFQRWAAEAYMDEPFHVPQTQRYCTGRWAEWDEKITTFPGLYLLGVALARAAGLASRLLGLQVETCGTAVLRAVSACFAVACVPLFYALAKVTSAQRTEQQALLMAAACALFPLHYFYAFLYYTDVPSAFFTLATYLATKRRRGGAAAGLAAAAVLMRQTNAVWVAFMAGEALLERCLPRAESKAEAAAGAAGGSGGQPARGSGPARRRRSTAEEAAQHVHPQQTRSSGGGSSRDSGSRPGGGPGGVLAQLGTAAARAWAARWQLVQEVWGLAGVCAAFAGFVVWNGGVVVGDRAHHAPVRHLAQPLYFCLYATLWLVPIFWAPAALWREARGTAASVAGGSAARSTAVWVALLAAMARTVQVGTLAHPFLLADNRHYTFYLWRRVVNRVWWARYALVPLYARSAAALWALLRGRGAPWAALFALATCLVLVPAHLIEFRYYTVPFYVLLLNLRPPTARQLALLVAGYAAVNAATIWVFVARPFAWPDGSVARFLW